MLLISWKYHCVKIVDSVLIHENTGYRNLWYTLRNVLFFGKFVFESSISPTGYRPIEILECYIFVFIVDSKQIFVYGLVKFWEFQQVKTWVNQKRNSVKCFLMSFEQQVASRETECKLFFKAFIMFFTVISQSF